MAQDSLDGLGFDPSLQPPSKPTQSEEKPVARTDVAGQKEKKGYVAGLEVKPLPKKE